jgi:hypothetical protein
LWSEFHKLINSIWIKEQLSDQWEESIIVPIPKKGDKIDCSNYREISMAFSYTILSNILLSRLSPYTDKIIGDHQYGFRRNRWTTDQVFCILQILEKIGSTMRQYISYSYTSRKPMIQLGGKYCIIF